ncbi:VWA domain-containing protein, partial [Patescibacteria group bacterium]|nr:VWA domain-containing protein [Patescibacteria group bacterium]
MKKNGLTKKRLFISSIIILILAVLGTGFTLAYKKVKLAQAQNPMPNPAPASDITAADRPIIKTVSPHNLNPGEPFNINLQIPGMQDASGAVTPAEVMFVIDSSWSMDRPAFPNKCVMYTNNDPVNGDKIRPHAQRLCYAKTSAVSLMEKLAAKRGVSAKVGYQLVSTYEKTWPNFDSDHNFYRFRGLTDITDANLRAKLEADLMGPCTDENCQMQNGTAMGIAIDKAVNELVNNGDPNSNKYIIFISDGHETMSPSVTGAYPVASWPSGWPPHPSGLTGRYASRWESLQGSGIKDQYRYVWGRLDQCLLTKGRKNSDERFIVPEMFISGSGYYIPVGNRQKMLDYCASGGRSPCAFSCAEINDCQTNPSSPFSSICRDNSYWLGIRDYFVSAPWYEGSPADQAQQNGIKVFSVGYYGGGSNTSREYMEQIARHLYPQEPGEISGYYAAESDSSYLYQIIEDILGVISNQYNGAPFTMIETLPPGASVSAGNVSISRDGVNLSLTPTLGHDAQGRRTITLNIVPGNYNSQT